MLTVNSLPQFTGAFEGDNPSLFEHQVFTGSGISTPARPFVSHAKLAEAGYQNIVAIGQCAFNDLQKRFDDLCGLFLGKTQVVYFGNDIVLG
jgi:hypothetical protein